MSTEEIDMNKPTLLVLAAGMGSRFGGLKQIEPLGPNGEIIIDYSVYDAKQAGFEKVVFVIKPELLDTFKEVIGSRVEKFIEVDYAFQTTDMVPEGYTCPEGRTRPWGTGHAVWCAREHLSGPFGIINADDFYGRDAFAVMGKWLSELPEGSTGKYSMVGFRVCNTLSENGSVARGVCATNESGMLTDVVERTEIMRVDGEICYKDENGEWIGVGEQTPVSMNFWGFTPDYFKHSEEQFVDFLKENIDKPKAEFFIPLVVDKLINSGSTCEVLDTTAKWFGVTYAADRQATVDKIQSLVDAGEYPNKLF